MPEWVPVILSGFLGVAFRLASRGYARDASAGIGIALAAGCAFVASGECYVSWTYLLVDLFQALLGFAAGTVAVQVISRTSNSLRRRRANAG